MNKEETTVWLREFHTCIHDHDGTTIGSKDPTYPYEYAVPGAGLRLSGNKASVLMSFPVTTFPKYDLIPEKYSKERLTLEPLRNGGECINITL